MRSLMFSLFIPSLTLGILWMITRGQQVDMKLKTLEHDIKTNVESMEKTKKEIIDQLKYGLSYFENDENTTANVKEN